MKKNILRSNIISAFDGVPYPGDNNIGVSGGRDDAERVTEWYRGVDWHLLDPDTIYPLGLYSMTPEAFHYYLPAYLLSSIDDNAGDEYEFTIDNITPPSDNAGYSQTTIDRFQAILDLMTPLQMQAIRDFLLFNLDNVLNLQKVEEYPDIYDNEIKRLRRSLDYWHRKSIK